MSMSDGRNTTNIAKAGTGAVETRFRRKDGTVIDVLLSSTPMDAAHLSRGVTFTALDITSASGEEALQKISKMQSVILDNSSVELLSCATVFLSGSI